MCPALLWPALAREEELLAAPKRQTVVDPDRVVAQGAAEAEERGERRIEGQLEPSTVSYAPVSSRAAARASRSARRSA